jgi:hypothetical protein
MIAVAARRIRHDEKVKDAALLAGRGNERIDTLDASDGWVTFTATVLRYDDETASHTELNDSSGMEGER